MGHHHGDHGHDGADRAERLEDPHQYRYLSAEGLYELLAPEPDWTVADLGSGTGFYTDDVAPLVDRVFAVDVDETMQDAHREKDVSEGVDLVTTDVGDLPFEDGTLDAALSIRTFHHGVAEALPEVHRVLRPGGRFAMLDWSATGAGERERGPAPADCFDLATAQSLLLDAGFEIRGARERRETFTVVAHRRE